MMAAYQPQPGGMHPGMPAHGHPGMPQTPGQHMGQPMMHPGASGPGQPQGGGMMGTQPGMPGGPHPGAGNGMGMPGQPPGQGMGGQSMAGGAPNAHALSHLNPQQQLLQQQQHMQQMQGHTQMTMQQHAFIRQRQMQAQAMAMQHQGGMQGMTQQQIQQFQQGGGAPHLPPHLQQAQAMLQIRQQQQAQAHHNQMNQQLAMQHVNSQQSHHSQPGPPNQQTPSGPPQMRPQSRMANPNEQNQTPQPPQAPQPPPQQAQQQQQPPAQAPAQGQGQQQGQPQGQQPGPAPGQAQSQPAQQNPQQGQQPNPQQGPQQMTPQQAQFIRQRNAMMQSQQARQMQLAQQAQGQTQQTQGGNLILRLMLLGDQLSSFNDTNGKDINEWNGFVDKHFAPEGRLLHQFHDGDPNSKTKTYEVLRPTIARYFWTYFDSGAHSLRLHTENAREVPAGGGRYYVTCSNATLTVSYPSGARLEMHGALNALFAPTLDLIECLDIQQTSTEEIVARSGIERVLSNFSPTLTTKSPKMAKNKLPKAQQKLQQQFDGLTIDHFPKAPKGSMGVTSRVQQFLEIGETMTAMTELMNFANEKNMRPELALDAWVAQYETQGPQQGNANGMAMGQRTPSMQNMQMPQGGNFSSPSMSNMNIPNGMMGSPHIANNPSLQANMNSHTPSPHQTNMAAPMMIPQHSQQGTNSSVASANTSPNTNNKRRRSTVKVEGDDVGDGQNTNQQRVKPSPRMTKKSKPGG